MTQFFVEKFNQQNRCSACSKGTLYGYSLCHSHLARARQQFKKWSKERKKLKLCIRCDCTSFNGFLRCKAHTDENRQKCAAWMARKTAENPNFHYDRWAERRTMYLSKNQCPMCKEHRYLSPGFTRCAPCRKKKYAKRRANAA